MPGLLPAFKTCPAVFAVGDTYQIMVPVTCDILFGVRVAGEEYFDHSNGIIRSSTRMHRVSIPTEALDKAGKYTVFYRKIIERKPYFSETEEPCEATYAFKPVPKDGPIRIYHLSDTHGRFEKAAAAATYFGDDTDVLILNGDIPDHSGKVENFDLIFRLCEAVTHGSLPCIFSRGNHDTRGFFAENIADYTLNLNGNSYYTFRFGRLWGILLDCGEDKTDDHAEYGHTVCCHQFRREETRYLEKVIANAKNEYEAEGIDYRIVIVHNPFSYTIEPPFDIEQPLFKQWLTMLDENVHPQLMISGHLHTTEVSLKGGSLDSKGQICPVVVGGRYTVDENNRINNHVGAAITLENGEATVRFTDSEHKVLEETVIRL